MQVCWAEIARRKKVNPTTAVALATCRQVVRVRAGFTDAAPPVFIYARLVCSLFHSLREEGRRCRASVFGISLRARLPFRSVCGLCIVCRDLYKGCRTAFVSGLVSRNNSSGHGISSSRFPLLRRVPLCGDRRIVIQSIPVTSQHSVYRA